MNYEDLKWMNQSLFSYKDKKYDSHGYLDISVSINTEDDINFSQPKLVFNLDNQGQRRNVRLTYDNVVDLIRAFNDMAKSLNDLFSKGDMGSITRRYNSNKDLVFEFSSTNVGTLIKLIINHNDSDRGKVILPIMPMFESLGQILKLFQKHYVDFSLNLPSRYLTSLSANRSLEITNLLKTLPSQLVPIQPEQYPDRREEIEPSINAASSTDEDRELVDEFTQFAEEEEPKVRIPELESEVLEPKEPIAQEYNSPFIRDVLKNNILNLEEMFNALYTNNDPLRTIMDTIHKGEGYTLLPGISELDLKSVAYISNLYFKMNFQSYIQNQTGFPAGIPVVKYDGDDSDRETVELSYDLMMISAYLKLYRNRMEAINSDPYTNGALIHFAFRCFLDVATYSYLKGKNSEAIKNNVVSRFKYFREVGFFDNYDRNLKDENQQPIYDSEVGEFIDKVFDNVVESENIDVRHFNAHDASSVKLHPKNNFSLEQITNDIVKYEIKVLFGQRIEDLTSDGEIILLFNTKMKRKYKPTDHKPTPRKKETHVVRYVKLKANELTEVIRQDFIDYITEISDGDSYDYFNEKFKLEELPEIILQAVYTWESHSQTSTKYTDYVVDVENCIDRDMILSKVKILDKTEIIEADGEWSFEDVEF
jgi:hypothetical protein